MGMRTKAAGKGRCKVAARGGMTIYEAVAQKAVLLKALDGHEEVEIDLSGVTELDTAGLQLLVLAKRVALKADKTLRLVAHSPACLEVLDCYGLGGYFGDPLVLASDGKEKKA